MSLTEPVLCMCVTHMGSCAWNRPALLWSTPLSSHRRWRCFSEVSVLEQPDRCRKLSLLYTPDHTTSSDTVPESPTEKHKECETVFSVKLLVKDHRHLFSAFYQLLPFHWMRLYNCIDQQLLLLVHYIVTIHGGLRNLFLHFLTILTYFLFTSFTYIFSQGFFLNKQLWKW